ncbi:rhomboid family intramembrane serine protease [Flavobacterium noncentrifugens]|uniref:Membrane associated serine protease, rhomboid family n=1 Tax=Flavobacterium noncentrifugens TaxID=1128970 RepID=A0A1G8V308_9FLAO|nr:rhomboid family intramembrane serine protease [Flavobacterium noncentrifugens]GEP50299.1 rhomboid family intramembrane serine protease [Flavobacterium noncentrifugens]SDJ59755.1 Membrane associated serine protease, rhomboid family [Flavobacterium noncentrifugens]
MNDNHFKFSASVILLPFLFVLSLWIVFWAEVTFRLNLGELGIYPRTFEGLRGVIFSPFLHGSIQHLYNNSIPMLILLAALRYFYREQFFKVVGYGILFSGLITWVIGRDSYHIGASGLIYVLVSFIFFKGLRTKYYRLVALSLVVIMIYGSLVWYVFPDVDKTISWEGHLGGLITGFAFAILLKTPEYQKMIKYDWEKSDFDPAGDKFLERFDENGNFVNLPIPEPDIEISVPENVTVIYNFRPSENPLENKAES